MSTFDERAARKELRAKRMNVTAISDRDRRSPDEFAYIEAYSDDNEQHVRAVLASEDIRYRYRVVHESRSTAGRPRWYLSYKTEEPLTVQQNDGTIADFTSRLDAVLERHGIPAAAGQEIRVLFRDGMCAAYDDGANDADTDYFG